MTGRFSRWRPLWVRVHRASGLFLALFLLIASSTGAVIAWEREIDGWLNPKLYRAGSGHDARAACRSGVDLIEHVERENPELKVGYAPLAWRPGDSVVMRVQRATQAGADLGFGEIFVDPGTGALQGRRLRTALSLERTQWLPMLYRLHHSLHLPFGKWLMGVVAVVWSVDCFVALWLSFPRWRVWRKSLRFRLRKGGHALQFDLHRSGGVWTWFALLMLASTAVTMNLKRELVRPALRAVASLRTAPFEYAKRLPCARLPILARQTIVDKARQEAQGLGLDATPGAISWSVEQNLYGVEFFNPRGDPSGQGGAGLGVTKMFFDGQTGNVIHLVRPGHGSMADVYYDAQFPLHSGRLLGKFGRALISAMGLVIVILCVTGILIWRRKRAHKAA